jgi:dienelactone hydrolase
MISAYFADQTAKLRDACLADVNSIDDWNAKQTVFRKQLLEMLGLDPLPERTDLNVTVTGTTEHEEFVVEKLHYQSRPRLYVTANLYRPKKVEGRLPAVLYVCGHGGVKKDGVSYGNKVHYQHHGAWFARNGYVCLTIDSLQLGEIEGIHHGTYRYDMWWWNNRGYTPAGVEAWNCIRALDYLQSRDDVDPERIGVTGRSGGGVYSWWISSIDERIQAAVPVAGITDLENHVIDGCVEGHCDCMFMVNTYRWDYPLVAALVAPRPLMIANTDQDRIFPLDGVVRTNNKARKVYELCGSGSELGLTITPGPHKDTQELRVPAFHWLNRHLKGEDPPITVVAEPFFSPEELKVFDDLPDDSINADVHETFVPAAPAPPVPGSRSEWQELRDGWRKALVEKSFAGWPEAPGPLDVKEAFAVENEGLCFSAHDFTSQGPVRLRLYLVRPVDLAEPQLAVLGVLDDEDWRSFVATMRCAFEDRIRAEPSEVYEELPPADEALFDQLRRAQKESPCVMAFVAPRGVGPTAWNQSEKKQTQIRRRFMLLGQTLDGMRVWDVRRAIQALRALDSLEPVPLVVQGERRAAGIALYASLFEPDVERLDLRDLPRTHREGPILLNVRRYLDLPQAAAMAVERSEVVIYQEDQKGWNYPAEIAHVLDLGDDRLSILAPPEAP